MSKIVDLIVTGVGICIVIAVLVFIIRQIVDHMAIVNNRLYKILRSAGISKKSTNSLKNTLKSEKINKIKRVIIPALFF
jgi:hypothetical protein